jgi:superfamily II DNA or RNA helicase
MFLVGLTGEEIYSSTAKELEDYLSIPLIVIYTIVKPNVPNDSPYSEVYRLGITRNEHRNELIKNICEKYHAAGKTVLVLVKEIAHGHKLAEMLACPFLSGNSSTDERLAEASKLRNGSRKLLVASTIFNEGLDFPDLDVVVIASGGESTIQTLQRVGRAMRKKQFGGIVIDFDDQTHKYLKAHSAARISDYEKRVGCSISRRGVNDNEYENV